MYIVVRNDTRLTCSRDGEASIATENKLAFAKHRCFFIFFVRSVGVGSAIGKAVLTLQNDKSAFTLVWLRCCTLHVDGRTIGVGDVYII